MTQLRVVPSPRERAAEQAKELLDGIVERATRMPFGQVAVRLVIQDHTIRLVEVTETEQHKMA